MDMNGSKVGSNFVAKFDKDTDAILTNENKLIILGQCIGDPNVSCIDGDLFAVGCQLIRKDVLSGDNLYKNVGTIDTPNWILGGSSSSINWGDINGTLSNQTDLQNALNDKADKNGTPKLFRYFNNAGVDSSDPLASRDSVTNYTELAREYDTTVQDLQFTGTGSNDLTINSITVKRPYTFTIDSQNNYAGLYFQGAGLNDASVDYAAYAGQRPLYFTFGIDSTIDNFSTGSGGFTGTPINGETFNDGLGNSFKFISYDIGTDTINAYSVVGNIVGTYTGADSGATITLVNAFTPGTNEVGAWADSIGNDGVWSIQPTVAYTIGTGADSLDVTFPGAGHTVGDFWGAYFVQGAVLLNLLSPSGPFTPGETITQASNPGASAVIGYDNGGNIALINIVGQLNLGASSGLITGSTSGQTATLNTFSSYADTFTWTDGTTTENQVVITTGSQVLDSGNIDIQFASNASHVVGDQWQLTFPTVTITTGYESNQVTFPGIPFPINVSAMVSTDGTDKMAVGVLDLSPFGDSPLLSGTIAIYGDGSQSTFTLKKGNGNINIFDTTTNKSLNIQMQAGDPYTVQVYNGITIYGFSIDANNFSYSTNGSTIFLPNYIGGPNEVLTSDGSGNTYWSSSSGVSPTNGIQLIGSDIGLGGPLIQPTDVITTSVNYLDFHGQNTNNNQQGIITNNIYGGVFNRPFAGSYSYNYANKAGVYELGTNHIGSILGYEDWSGFSQLASFTRNTANIDIGFVENYTLLVPDSSGSTQYYKQVAADQTTINSVEFYSGNNPFTGSYGHQVQFNVELASQSQTYYQKVNDTVNNVEVSTVYSLDYLGAPRYTLNVSNSLDSQQLIFTNTYFGSNKYPNTRDDTPANTPANFIFTDSSGAFLSAPLSSFVQSYTVQTISSNTILNNTTIKDRNLVDNSGGNITITLPAVSSVVIGKEYTFKQITTNILATITLQGNGTEQIDGSSSYTFPTPLGGYVSVDVWSDGTQWFIK